jgi:hypothetical protein
MQKFTETRKEELGDAVIAIGVSRGLPGSLRLG